MLKVIILILFPLFSSLALEPISQAPIKQTLKLAFKKAAYMEAILIQDPISKSEENKTIYTVYSKDKKRLGLVRKIVTTTGCHSACRALLFVLVFDSAGKFISIIPVEPLTKKGHAPFTTEDYFKLDQILANVPVSFYLAKDPNELVDALSGATKKDFSTDVVPLAAYTSFRVHQYKEQTRKFILDWLSKKK